MYWLARSPLFSKELSGNSETAEFLRRSSPSSIFFAMCRLNCLSGEFDDREPRRTHNLTKDRSLAKMCGPPPADLTASSNDLMIIPQLIPITPTRALPHFKLVPAFHHDQQNSMTQKNSPPPFPWASPTPLPAHHSKPATLVL